MISECRAYLEEKLRAAMGNETKVFHTYKELAACMESHVGSVLIDGETLTESGHKAMLPGQTNPALKVLEREARFSVSMGEYTLEALEAMYESFLSSLGRVIPVGGGYSGIVTVSNAEWLLKEDNVLKANVSVVMAVTCMGGLWKPIATMPIKKIQVEMED